MSEQKTGFISTHAPLLEYPIALNHNGRKVLLIIPEDLTEAEAERLTRIIKSLAVDWKQ